MSNCKNCNAPIELKQGRRPREFCDNNNYCKQQYYLKNKKGKKAKGSVTIPIEQLEENKLYTWVGGELIDYIPNKFLEVKDANKKTNLVEPNKPLGSDKTNFTINTAKPPKLPGESALDYRIRCEELSKLKQN